MHKDNNHRKSSKPQPITGAGCRAQVRVVDKVPLLIFDKFVWFCLSSRRCVKTPYRSSGGGMTKIFAVALSLAVGSSAAQAIDLSVAAPTQAAARFAAVSVTESQGVRVIVSNVLEPSNAPSSDPCPVEVRFVGADGALLGETRILQLDAGVSSSVSAVHPSSLVRAIVNVGEAGPATKTCAIRTSLEVFDAQTGTTFLSVPGESSVATRECITTEVALAPVAARKIVPSRPPASNSTFGLAPKNTPGRRNTSSAPLRREAGSR
jgi:hypothetical protein